MFTALCVAVLCLVAHLLSCSRQVARSPRKELVGLSWTVLPWLCGCVSSGRLAVALTGGLWGLGLH